MAGRGRGLTLPAWMTQGVAEQGSLETNGAGPSEPPAVGVQGQYDLDHSTNQTADIPPAKAQEGNANTYAMQSVQNTPTQSSLTNGVHTASVDATGGVHNPASAPGMAAAPQAYVPSTGYAYPPSMPVGMPMPGYMGMPPNFPQQMYPGMPAAPGSYPGMMMPTHMMGYPPQGAGMPGAMPNATAPGAPFFGFPNFPRPMAMPTASTPILPLPSKAAPVAGAASKASAAPTGIQDSNNDASAWSEHITEKDQRKYWYNRVTQVSTFDKPACLKTPEERSIPPCPWKEYATAEGKKYYSNGTETTWEMPEEYRVWSEKVEAASKKRRVPTVDTAGGGANANTKNGVTPTAHDGPSKSNLKQQRKNSNGNSKKTNDGSDEEPPQTEIVYATPEEAVEAFRSLLDDRSIPSTMKYKEVQEICQSDPRWNAVKSAGDRKQNLAEYQTKKIKHEKEQKKEKLKKSRDAFLLLLAECAEIDSNTRWRTAQTFICNDIRYKSVEDDRDREEFFREFVSELAKKEREDAEKGRRNALEIFKGYLQRLYEDGAISRRTIWSDAKPSLGPAIADVRYAALTESDMRHALQDFTNDLERQFKEGLKQNREAQRDVCAEKEKEFKAMLSRLSHSENGGTPLLTHLNKWKDVHELIEATTEFADLSAAYEKMNSIDEEYDKSGGRGRGRSRSVSAADKAPGGKRTKQVKDIFEQYLAELEAEYKADKRLIKSALSAENVTITHASQYADILDVISRVASTEDPLSALNELLTKREYIVRTYVTDVIDFLREEHEEDLRVAKKLETRFIELLQEYYYRSNHVGISWEEAKDDLYHRSAYINLERSERRRIFDKYMAELAEKLAAKKKVTAGVEVVSEDVAPVAGASDPSKDHHRPSDSSSSSSSSDDSSSSEEEGRAVEKKSKKRKKDKKSKKKSSSDHKKKKRSRESDSEEEEGEISSKKKSSRKK